MRDWKLRGQSAVVTGRSVLADGIRDALFEEGVSVRREPEAETDILITVPDVLNVPMPTPSDIDHGAFSKHMETLFEAPRQLTHDVLPGMKAQGSGRILHLIGGFEPMIFHPEYAAWGAMAAWAKSLVRDIGKSGPTVNLIQAGIGLEHPNVGAVPSGRGCTREDIAHLIVFLCSPYARYITGTVIPVDGGLSRFQH